MRLLTFVLLFYIDCSLLFSQGEKPGCIVLMKGINSTYTGDCKEGYANGKGIAKGEDYYKGSFLEGLPDGYGIYRFKNGNIYSGEWKFGLKDGKGKFTSVIDGKKLVVSGYWKEDNYMGPVMPDADYSVTNRSNIENYSVKKVNSDKNEIKVSFEKAMNKYLPEDLTYEVSSGYVNKMGQSLVFNYNSCPVYCTFHFTIMTSGGRRECNFGFTILKPGEYEVFLSNN
jgi:hypothetical protein